MDSQLRLNEQYRLATFDGLDRKGSHVHSRIASWIVFFLLMLAGFCSIGVRVFLRNQAQSADRGSRWRLTYEVEVDADKAGVKVQVAIPTDSPHIRVFRQNLSFGDLTTDRSAQLSNKSLLRFVTQKPGRHFFAAQFDIELLPQSTVVRETSYESFSSQELVPFLRATPTIQIQSVAVQNTIQQLRDHRTTVDDPIRQIFEFCISEIDEDVEGESPSDAEGAIAQRVGTTLGRAKAMVALCRADNIQARIVAGFEVQEQPEVETKVWVESLRNGLWESHDLTAGTFGQVPTKLIPVRRDSEHIVYVTDRTDSEVKFSIGSLPNTETLSAASRHPAQILDLRRLPTTMHEVLSVILLIPLGALVTAFFQTIIGLRTIGIFGPTLIALSFVMADWRTGVAVFALVIVVGLMSRAILDRLKLLMVPKLGFMLTLVVLILVFTISILDYLHLTPSPQAVLLPMVILTMTIERFYVATAESGLGAALQLLLNTIVVSFICFLTLGWRQVGELVMQFPEIHFFTLAMLAFLGRYNGYRLTELWRFRDLSDFSKNTSYT